MRAPSEVLMPLPSRSKKAMQLLLGLGLAAFNIWRDKFPTKAPSWTVNAPTLSSARHLLFRTDRSEPPTKSPPAAKAVNHFGFRCGSPKHLGTARFSKSGFSLKVRFCEA